MGEWIGVSAGGVRCSAWLGDGCHFDVTGAVCAISLSSHAAMSSHRRCQNPALRGSSRGLPCLCPLRPRNILSARGLPADRECRERQAMATRSLPGWSLARIRCAYLELDNRRHSVTMNTMHSNTSRPLYGSYLAPDGEVFQLATPCDVYRAFRRLLEAMPRTKVFAVRGRPEAGVEVIAPGFEGHFR